jgi:protein SCO1/2
VAVVAALGAGSSRAEGPAGASGAAPAAPSASFGRGNNPYADRFPNLVLKTHQGEVVRFYDDLLKGKIVLINFMYASCEER